MFSEPADANSGKGSSLITISSPLNYLIIVVNSSRPMVNEIREKYSKDKSDLGLELTQTAENLNRVLELESMKLEI